MQQLKILRTSQEVCNLVEYLKDKEFVAFDTETTGLDKESTVIGISICAELDVGYYVVLREWDPINKKLIQLDNLWDSIIYLLQELLFKKLIAHNAVFDCYMIVNNFNVQLIDSLHTDTMILAHLLDENRHCGLKELGVSLFGESANQEQKEMKESVLKNGGQLTKANYELYKADSELIAKYGAKDAILTLSIFHTLVPELFEQNLDKFFYEEESMPLLKETTYKLNTVGLKVDIDKLNKLKQTLEAECLEAKSFIYKEIEQYTKDKYPSKSKTTTFNINASKQLAWLLFNELENDYLTLTDAGKEVCKFLGLKLPYTRKARREFVHACIQKKGMPYTLEVNNKITGKVTKPKKVADYWHYIACGSDVLKTLSKRYKWVEKLLEYKKNEKLLNTYVEGIQSRMKYGIIHPSYLQHGTTSGRYSSRNPNFQNLPRGDKRIKSCIVARPGNVFVGSDFSQLEPRVFASMSGDQRLLDSFTNGSDIYSVIGMEVFDKADAIPLKDGATNAFGVKYPGLRDIAKVVMLSATYGTTASKMAPTISKSIEDAQQVINSYFESFPDVKKFQLQAHAEAKNNGVVYSYFGRPRRMPKALSINQLYRTKMHGDLPYEFRNLLNLGVNHKIQCTAASITNRACIAFYNELDLYMAHWEVNIVMQVHDEIIVECPQEIAEDIKIILRRVMENTVKLPGVELKAEPKIGADLAQLK